MTQYVLGFCFSPSRGWVVLVEKQRPDWMRGLWNGVGGHVEEGEAPEEAMSREFWEEAGVRVEDWMHFATLRGEGFEVLCFTSVTALVHEIHTRTDEVVELKSLDRIPALQKVSNLPWLIEMADQAHQHDWPYLIQERAA